VSPVEYPSAEPTGLYVTEAELRERLGKDEAALSDAALLRLARFAQALVENSLGSLPRHTSGPQEGLKIAEADVAAYQWEALREAVISIVQHLDANPGVLGGARFDEVSGPDFSYSGATGKLWGDEAPTWLRTSGLVPTGARARP
jgi:hypothetical protein